MDNNSEIHSEPRSKSQSEGRVPDTLTPTEKALRTPLTRREFLGGLGGAISNLLSGNQNDQESTLAREFVVWTPPDVQRIMAGVPGFKGGTSHRMQWRDNAQIWKVDFNEHDSSPSDYGKVFGSVTYDKPMRTCGVLIRDVDGTGPGPTLVRYLLSGESATMLKGKLPNLMLVEQRRRNDNRGDELWRQEPEALKVITEPSGKTWLEIKIPRIEGDNNGHATYKLVNKSGVTVTKDNSILPVDTEHIETFNQTEFRIIPGQTEGRLESAFGQPIQLAPSE